jgi:DNA-binding GntR family transcriptional regulator
VKPQAVACSVVERIVDEAAIDLDGSDAGGFGLFERLHDAPCLLDLLRRELGVRPLHGLDLPGVDNDASLEAEAPGEQGVLEQAIVVMDVGVGAVDRRWHPSCAGGNYDTGARVQEFRRLRRQIDADIDREIAKTEHQSHNAFRSGESDLLAANESDCGLDQWQEADLSVGDASLPFQTFHQLVQRPERLGAFDLGDHQAVELRADHRLDISLGQPGVSPVDAHAHHRLVVGREGGACRRARGDLLRVRDGVLEIEHDRIGSELADLLEPAGMVTWRKEEGAEGLSLPIDRRTGPDHGQGVYILFPLDAASPPFAPPRHLTKTELALELLRERIRSGELAPGQRLGLEELTQLLGMSATPIREALRLLQADRLIDYRPHHGVVVTELPPEVTLEIYRIRSLLEPLATELAVADLLPERLGELERLHTVLKAAVSSGRGKRIAEVNVAWHWTLYESANSTYLNDFIRRLWEGFPWRTMWALPGRAEQSLQEHEAMMMAIRVRDGIQAAARMREHIESGAETLVDGPEQPSQA